MTAHDTQHEPSQAAAALTHATAFIPYPAIERHGVIGDRRTAALVAADGTLDWLCLPNYDNASLFGALLDAECGGFWRVGPQLLRMGEQRYLDDTAVLATTWSLPEGDLELTDCMEAPDGDEYEGGRDREDDQRVVVRRLSCRRGAVACTAKLRPRHDMSDAARVTRVDNGYTLEVGDHTLACWASIPLAAHPDGLSAEWRLQQGDELWMVVAMGSLPRDWSLQSARRQLTSAVAYWRRWYGDLSYGGPREELVKRSGMIIHLLGYAPEGSLVAAPTTSLPERIGGNRNYDYRYAWVRDASLAAATLVTLGDVEAGAHYLRWLAQLQPGEHGPLQVLYHVNGSPDVHVEERTDITGYRSSLPVLNGNRAWKQSQLGSYGFLADCAFDYLEQGGQLDAVDRDLLERIASFTTEHWSEPDSGIWELETQAHFVSSKVMSWVVLDRAITIFERYLKQQVPPQWRTVRAQIHAEVLARGWSETIQSFREHYDEDSVDAATLLIPVMRFLPATDPRVAATVARIESALTIEGQVYRFVPKLSPVGSDLPVGAFEGAFNPCTFWLATTYALMGQPERAERVLDRVEAVARPLGLFAEELDARTGTFLGNTPLLFSHAEYVRAVRATQQARAHDGNAGDGAAPRA